MNVTTLYENEELIFLDKPAGMLVIPDRFDAQIPVLKALAEKRGSQKLFILHRIDRQTSGVVVFAKTESAHKYYSLQFQNHEAIKHYDAIVSGMLATEAGTIDAPIATHPSIAGKMMVAKKGKASRTDYNVMQQWPLYAHLNLRIYTGRTHQIRVHLASIGHPVLCDDLYGKDQPFYLSTIKKGYKLSTHAEAEKPLLSRLALHARSLSLKTPKDEWLTVTAPLPRDMSAVVRQLQKHFPPRQ